MKMINFAPLVKESNKLTDDIFVIYDELKKHDAVLSRRLMVTQVFVQMEALSSLVRSVINDYYDSGKGDVTELDRADTIVMHGDDYRIDDDGKVTLSKKKIRTLAHVMYTLNFAARIQKKVFDAKKETHWQDVEPAIKIHNRVTHPKSVKDLDVTEKELALAMNAMRWFISCLAKL